MTKRVAVASVGRSDFSILTPLVKRLQSAPDFDVGMWITGAHFDQNSGSTINEVLASGLPVWAQAPVSYTASEPASVTSTMARVMDGVQHLLAARTRPDIVVLLGDRFEAIAIGLALTIQNVKVCHISGGSITEGAFDDVFRHCLTQTAEIHFCDTLRFGQRINQLGAVPESIHVVGALGLDGIRERVPIPWPELQSDLGAEALGGPGFWLATFHPETRNPNSTELLTSAAIRELEHSESPVLYTYPNADPESGLIRRLIDEACDRNQNHLAVPNLGASRFYAALQHAGGMIGNSSSGIIEAASFRIPVVNVGDRQKGRFCGANVIHTSSDPDAIRHAIEHARSEEMASLLAHFENPYGDGRAAVRIEAALRAHLDEPPTGPRRFSDYVPARVRAMSDSMAEHADPK